MIEKKKIDWLLIIAYLLLSLIGLLMIYSASSYRLLTRDQPPASLFLRQLVFLLLSWVLLFIIQRTRREIQKRICRKTILEGSLPSITDA